MIDLLVQASTLVVLSVGMFWGYQRWVRPHAQTVGWEGTGLLLLIVLTFLGGAIGSPIWWFDDPRSFSWDLPPLASRLLGAAGWSFVTVAWLALERPTLERLRLVLILLATYLAPLVLAILVFHVDRFDWSAPITYMFFLIAGGMSLAAVYFLIRQPKTPMPAPERAQTIRAPIRVWLVIVALITAFWGSALFVTARGPTTLIWAWPGDLLTSWLIGVMLLTIAVGSIFSLGSAVRIQMMLVMTATYGIGLTVASLWNTLVGKPIPLAYVGTFAAIFFGSVLFLLVDRTANHQSVVGINHTIKR